MTTVNIVTHDDGTTECTLEMNDKRIVVKLKENQFGAMEFNAVLYGFNGPENMIEHLMHLKNIIDEHNQLKVV